MVGERVLVRLRHRHRQQPRPAARQIATASDPPRPTIVIAGINPITELYLQSIAEFGDEVAVAGILGRNDNHTGRLVRQYPVLGRPEDVARIVSELEVHGVVIDRIVVTTPFERLPADARAALLDLARGSTITLATFADQLKSCLDGKPRADGAGPGGRQQQPLSPAAARLFANRDLHPAGGYWRVKRPIDIILAAALIVLLSPLIATVAALVAIDVGAPLTFWQRRPGLRRRPFRLYKLRTMQPALDGRGRRLSDAQRLSRVGRLLRRLRLDELPQLYNILVGHMSFVGPRPLLSRDQSACACARLSARPGLTGWAQVNGGNSLSQADKMALDLWYVGNASLSLDLRILLLTVRMVIVGERQNPSAVRLAWSFLERAGLPAPADAAEHLELGAPLRA
jgi:lipopolysaccharide/colanic/teichoic acid biosynthesis glycosyltransferase